MAHEKEKQTKTNAVRMVQAAGFPHNVITFPCEKALSGVEVATLLHEDADRVFKTLVTQGKSGQHYVFMIPVACELDLKKAAHACGEKAIALIPAKTLLPLTGYIHGGCSPIGMKTVFPTFIDDTAELYDTILFSGGRIGCQLELSPQHLSELVPLTFADIIA